VSGQANTHRSVQARRTSSIGGRQEVSYTPEAAELFRHVLLDELHIEGLLEPVAV
jgi:hypothetical protein